jgi:hypothetical protein
MALRPRISVKESKNSIVINECTGKYSGDNNGGYGVPNALLSSVTKAQFEIYVPEATTPFVLPVFPDFPSDDTELGYEVLVSQLGLKTVTSGVWKIGYRVTGVVGGLEYEKYTEAKEAFFKSAECCVDKLVASTANVPVNVFMKDEKKKLAAELSILLKFAKYNAKCGNFDGAQTNLKFINLQCGCCS